MREGEQPLPDQLPGMRGLDVARLILAEQPDQVIVLVITEYDTATVAAALALGVRACVPKTDVRRLPAQLLDLPAQLLEESS